MDEATRTFIAIRKGEEWRDWQEAKALLIVGAAVGFAVGLMLGLLWGAHVGWLECIGR